MTKIVIATTADLKFFNAQLKKGDTESNSKAKVRVPRKANILITSISELVRSPYLTSPDMRIFFATSVNILDMPYHTQNMITLRREIDYPLYFENSHQMIRAVVAQKGCKLDVLINDPSPLVRIEVAKHWYGLEKLIHDSDNIVKAEAVAQLSIMEELRNIDDVRHNIGI